jgi:F-type H+-transporting ATPase subunit b
MGQTMHYLAAATQQDPLIPSLPELIIGTICFVLVFGVLGKMLLPRITAMLEERTKQIEGGLKQAEKAQEEANHTLESYRAQLAEARHDASRLREEAREQGAQIIAEMREQAQAEARRLTEAAQAQIESERRQALASLRTEVGAIAVELASRVVGESLEDQARQSGVVDRFLDELEREASPGASATR